MPTCSANQAEVILRSFINSFIRKSINYTLF
nr:MAG TPA: protein of unknown function (DUF4783) [Caudoviricetes sp.]